MRALLLSSVLVALLGCASRPPAAHGQAEMDPTAAPAIPASVCTVRQNRPGETGFPDPMLRPITPEDRYDERGLLVYAVDQPEYVSVRRSWFAHDAHGRIVHVRRRIDRVEVPSGLVRPVCDDGPCPPPPDNDRDVVEEERRYDSRGRVVASVERTTHYDHQGGTWRDDPDPPRPEPGSICDLEPAACPRPHVRVGGTFRAFAVGTRTIALRYDDPALDLPTSVRVSFVERWRLGASDEWRERRPPDESTIAYAYAIEPRVVTRFRVEGESRAPDRRIVRDEAGRVLSETYFFEGEVELRHRYDAGGAARGDDARGSRWRRDRRGDVRLRSGVRARPWSARGRDRAAVAVARYFALHVSRHAFSSAHAGSPAHAVACAQHAVAMHASVAG